MFGPVGGTTPAHHERGSVREMTIRFANARSVTILLLSAAALGMSGCELLPGLLGSHPTPTMTSLPPPSLTVTVEQAEGTMGGAPIDRTQLEVRGHQNDLGIALEVSIPPSTRLTVFADGNGAADNPYGPGGGGTRFADAGASRPDAGALNGSTLPPNEASIEACGELCLPADDSALEMTETSEGRRVAVDASWVSGDHIHLVLLLQEQP